MKPRLTFRYMGGSGMICVGGPTEYIGCAIPERRDTLVDLLEDFSPTDKEIYWSDVVTGRNGTRILESSTLVLKK